MGLAKEQALPLSGLLSKISHLQEQALSSADLSSYCGPKIGEGKDRLFLLMIPLSGVVGVAQDLSKVRARSIRTQSVNTFLE